jgi:hypothetical protein
MNLHLSSQEKGLSGMGLSKNEMIQREDFEDMKKHYPKYAWVGNRISSANMARLYRLKRKTKIPITQLVSQAVEEFLDRQENREVENDS